MRTREVLFVGGPLDGQIKIIEGSAPVYDYVEPPPWELLWSSDRIEGQLPLEIKVKHYDLKHFMAYNPDAPYDGDPRNWEGFLRQKGAIVMDCWVAFAEGWE